MIVKRKLFSYIGFIDLVPTEVSLSKELKLELMKKTKLANLLGKINYIKKKQDKCVFYNIIINNKHVGDLELSEENPRELVFDVVGVDDKKYLQLIINWVLSNAKDWGFFTVSSQFFLEEDSKDVYNLYSKLGFKREEKYIKPNNLVLVVYEKKL